eukprot:2153021-Rhodomonas_salina.1
MTIVGFDLQPGGVSTMMMQSGTKLSGWIMMSGGQSGQRLSMLGPMCVVTLGASCPFRLPRRPGAAVMPLIRGSAIWLCMRFCASRTSEQCIILCPSVSVWRLQRMHRVGSTSSSFSTSSDWGSSSDRVQWFSLISPRAA